MRPYTARVMRHKYRADSLRDELAEALWELRKLRQERQRYADAWREMSEVAYRLRMDNGWLSGAYTETEGLRADECRQNDRARGAVGLLARTVRRLRRERYDVAWLDEFHAIPPQDSTAPRYITRHEALRLSRQTLEDAERERSEMVYDVTCWADGDGNTQWSEDRMP